jgi:hypothetical protein
VKMPIVKPRARISVVEASGMLAEKLMAPFSMLTAAMTCDLSVAAKYRYCLWLGQRGSTVE